MSMRAVRRLFFTGALAFLLSSTGFGQGNLALSSGVASVGSPVTLNLSLSGTSSSNSPASVQFNLTFTASEFSSIVVDAGAESTNKGKSVLCSPSSGRVNCMIWGTNKTTLSDGVIATITVIRSSAAYINMPISVSEAHAFDAAGGALPEISTSGGNIQLGGGTPPPVAPSLSSLSCTPALLGSNASAACTVSLSQATTSATSVALSSNNTGLSVPASVVVAAGASQATFSASTGTLPSSIGATAILTATLSGVSRTASITLDILPSLLSSLSCLPNPLTSGASSVCTALFSKAVTANTPISLSVSGGSTSSAPAGLVAAYGFNEGTGTVLKDLSGNGNNGTIIGATWSTTGRSGKALSFNGTSNRVDIPNSTKLALTNGMTMEAWVRPSVVPSAWRAIITKEQSGGLVYGLYANSDTNRPSVNIFIGREQDTRGTFQLAANTWVHLAATYDGTTLRLYVNGALASSKTLAGKIPVSTGLLRIGANTVWGEYFNGLIDEVRIYNRPLSLAEIQADMNAPVTEGGGGPVLTIPSSITLSAGLSAAVFTATAGQVSTTTTAQLTATSGSASKTLTVTVVPATSILLSQSTPTSGADTNSSASLKAAAETSANVQSLACLPALIEPGDRSSCTLTLNRPASADTNVAVTTSSALRASSSVVVPNGESAAKFQIKALIGKASDETVSAALSSEPVSAAIRVAPKKLTILAPEQRTSVNGEAVRFSVEVIEPNNLPVQLAAADLPPGAQFDANSKEFFWQPNTQSDGNFPVTFNATSGTGETSSVKVQVEVMSGNPLIESVVNAATRSAEGACSPGAIASIRGKSLLRSHDDVEVLVNGEQASLLQTSANEITIQCPDLPARTPLQIQVSRGLAISNTFNLTMSDAAPGLFSADNTGKGEALTPFGATNTKGFAEKLLSETVTAGEPGTISLLATGLGANPGDVPVVLFIGDLVVPVKSAVEESPGLWRISASLPDQAGVGEQVPVQLRIGSGPLALSSNTVTIPMESSSTKLRAD